MRLEGILSVEALFPNCGFQLDGMTGSQDRDHVGQNTQDLVLRSMVLDRFWLP